MSESEVAPALSADGDSIPAPKELFAALYTDLHRIAARELRRNAAMTSSPTTLLHETFLNLSPRAAEMFSDKAHFMAYATRAMRGLIVDQLRARSSQKRGGEFEITSLPTDLPHIAGQIDEIAKLSDALDALAAIDPELAQCVDLKFFCGYSLTEIAQMLDISERTVQRRWDKARVLLYGLINDTRGGQQDSAGASSVCAKPDGAQ